MYCTQLFGLNVVTGVIKHSIATPVGKKNRKGAQSAASLGSLKKFWIKIDKAKKSSARSHKAKKS